LSIEVFSLSQKAMENGLPTPSSDIYYQDGVLVDVGVDGDLAYKILDAMGVTEKLEKIVLTHCHYDHSGGTKRLRELTDSEVLVHEHGAEALEKGDSSRTASSLFGIEIESFKPDKTLSGGDRVGTLEVIHTPGHTRDSICLHNPDTKDLFTGDTVFPNGRPGRTDLPTGDTQKMIKSLKKIRKIDAKQIYTGHGGAGDPRSIDKAIKYLETSYI